MIIPYYGPEHYEFYKTTSESHQWSVLPEEFLPLVGFVSYINDKPAALIFVYDTVGTKWAVMEWLMCDYAFNKQERDQAITECIKAATQYAVNNGLTLFTSCKGDKLKQRYAQAGFIKTDESMTNFIFKG